MGQGYVLSYAAGTIWEWFKLVPFFKGRTDDSEGGGGAGGFQKKYFDRQTP